MVTRLEGVNTALPLRLPCGPALTSGQEHRAHLEEELRQATERFLCSIGVVQAGAKPLRLRSLDGSKRQSMDGNRSDAAHGDSTSSRSSLDAGSGDGGRLSSADGRHMLSSLYKPSLKGFNICGCSKVAGAAPGL